MKRFRVMAAALCAAVLLCGFSVPAYAYADGGEGADYGDPTMTEETPAPEPEPTIEPGEGFSEEGNLVTRDLLYDEHTNKQFITVQTAGGNTFYITRYSTIPLCRRPRLTTSGAPTNFRTLCPEVHIRPKASTFAVLAFAMFQNIL